MKIEGFLMRQQVKIRVDFLVENIALYLQIVDTTWKASGPYSRVPASARAMAKAGNLAALANNQASLDDVASTPKDWHAYGRPSGFSYPGAAKIGSPPSGQSRAGIESGTMIPTWPSDSCRRRSSREIFAQSRCQT
jgi:hypothetical protein